MKTLFGVSLLLMAQLPLMAVQVGDTFEQVQIEKGIPPGKMGAGGFIILAYPDATIRLQDNRVIRISGPPRRLSIVPAPKPKPKPRPVPAWIDDVDAAFTQAREKNRHVLLFFTGAGWGSRSQHLENEVLSTPEFVRYANDNLVLLKMDFPKAAPSTATEVEENGGAAAAPSTSAPAAANRARSGDDLKGEDYPMVFVLDSDGRPSGSLGFPDGGPGPFIDALKKL